jgi:peptidoglycan/xylan/chitin deacetylase (PgdA/CDA1 family)
VLFVPTREVGGTAHWLDGEPVACWDDVRELMAAGVRIGSHARRHRRLAGLDTAALDDELAGSLADLRSLAGNPVAAVAYPYGDHDDRVCAAARAAGMSVGFTTLKGRNGATTDPYRLRRVSIHGDDGALAGLWKALTGEGLPRSWLRLRSLRRGLLRAVSSERDRAPRERARGMRRRPVRRGRDSRRCRDQGGGDPSGNG